MVENDKKIYADKVFINGKIYTLDKSEHIFESIAIKGNKILDVGFLKDIKKFIGYNTEIINLYGKMVLPSFSDTHMHIPGRFLIKNNDIYLYDEFSLEGYLKVVKSYINKYTKNNKIPSDENFIIYGSGWTKSAFDGIDSLIGPKKEYLDKINSEIGIVLYAYDGHCAWLNSKAFEILNITKDTVDPNIMKDENLELWGCIYEDSMILIPKKNYTKEQCIEAFESYQQEMYSYGITNVVSVSIGYASGFFDLDYFKYIIEENKLNMRISYVDYLEPDKYKFQIEKIIANRKKDIFNSQFFKVVGTKVFADGVVDYKTALLSEPYMKSYTDEKDNYGYLIWDLLNLVQAIVLSNKNNLQCHIHTIGDGAVKECLDAFEIAKNIIEDKLLLKKCRNLLIHLQLIRKRDIKRIKDLELLLSIQPYWHYKIPGLWEEVEYKNLGERAEYEYPLASLLNDVFLTASSDYPATITPNPLNAIQVGATRNLANTSLNSLEQIENIDDERYLLNKHERVDVIDLIKMFTKNGAFLTFKENEIGTLEKGKKADFIVLDKDITEIDLLDIKNTKVIMTYFEGNLVYKNKI